MKIGKAVLAIYDKYDQDFGLLDERWASSKDREKVSDEQCVLFSEYVEKLSESKNESYSKRLRNAALKRALEIEQVMDQEVVDELKRRILG